MESESNDLRNVSRLCNYVQLAEQSVIERENSKQKQKTKLTQTERNEIRHLLGRVTTGRIDQDIKTIAGHFGCSRMTFTECTLVLRQKTKKKMNDFSNRPSGAKQDQASLKLRDLQDNP